MLKHTLTLLHGDSKMKSSRHLTFHTRRDAWVEVNLSAIEQNTLALRRHVPEGIEIMAVIKADAYGHGAVMVLPTLEASGISMVGVASMDEAVQIRESGLPLSVMVLGVTPDWAMHYALEHNIELTVFSEQHLASLQRLFETTQTPVKIHIKVDTGMHRIGISWDKAAAFINHCFTLPYVTVEGVFSHFAHTSDSSFTDLQVSRWEQVLSQLNRRPQRCHLANSAGTWHGHFGAGNMIRSGLTLFGYTGDDSLQVEDLEPAMSLKARIVHLFELPPGEGISYGQTFHNNTSAPRLIATLPLGYADGVPRGLSGKIHALYAGQRIPQVGVITMDQLMVDVTGVDDPRVGDVVTLIGKSGEERVTLTDWASCIQTIEYELMCGLRVRLPKTYIR